MLLSFGFEFLREIERNDKSLPDQIVWGGTGSILVINIDSFFEKWTKRFLNMKRREENKLDIQ